MTYGLEMQEERITVDSIKRWTKNQMSFGISAGMKSVITIFRRLLTTCCCRLIIQEFFMSDILREQLLS